MGSKHMDKKYILAIDRGQTAIKAAACTIKGDIVHVESLKCEPIRNRNAGWAEQDMDIIWQQAVQVIQKLLKRSGIFPEEFLAVSFSGQGGGNFLVSEEGKAIYPGVLSLDNRHEEVESLFPDSEKTAIPRTVAFMRWLKEKEPETFKKTKWILGSKDWIRFCLTGEAYADMSDPPAPADLDAGKYLRECLEAAGVPECMNMLPPLVYGSEVCGSITPGAAEETGLVSGTPVVAGAHDMIACSIGAGGNRQGHLAIIMGTLGINIGVVEGHTELDAPGLPGESFTFGGAVRGMRTATTSIGSGCNTMNFFLDMLFKQEKEEAGKRGISVFEFLEQKLLKRKPSAVVFEPYILGTFYNSCAKAGFLGITAQTTREDILLGMFQGICISMCMEIRKLEERIQEFDDIWLVGGGSKSRIWGQMFADVLKRPVHVCETGEVGCRGAAVCAGIALGYYTPDKGFPKPEAADTYITREDYADIYEKQLKQYEDIYERLYRR